MPKRLEGKATIITGAGSGIGRAMARRFAAEGAFVCANDLRADLLDELSAEIDAPDGRFSACPGDITDSDFVATLIQAAAERCGRLDVLVNNAGGAQANVALNLVTDEVWRRTFALNVDAAFFGVRAALAVMVPQRAGSIISTASLAGLGGYACLSGYGAAKAALIQMTRDAAVEFAHTGIRFNCIAPGPIRTPPMDEWMDTLPKGRDDYVAQVPQGRLGTPDDIVNAALFLASDESEYVNGTTLAVDGGSSAKLGGPHP